MGRKKYSKELKTRDGIADDWPIDYTQLEPFFSKNDKIMGVPGIADDTGLPIYEKKYH